MVAGAAAVGGALIGGPAGVIFSLVGGIAGGIVDERLGIFGRSPKPGDFQGAQVEGLASGTPFVYCVGRYNRVAGQRLWTGDLIRERASSVNKKGVQTPEIVRADWSSATVAHAAHSVLRGWWDSEKVYDAQTLRPDINAAHGDTITIDWWTAYRPGNLAFPIIQWQLIIRTASDGNGRAVPGAPDLTGYSPGEQVNLTFTDTTHGTQVSRKTGSGTQTPWLVVSSKELLKGNSELVLDLLFDQTRTAKDFGWFDTALPAPGLFPKLSGPFIYPPTVGSNLLIQHLDIIPWKQGIFRDPATDFTVRLGATVQDPLPAMVGALGEDAEHFPGMTVLGVASADVASFGSRVPNSEWMVSTSATDVYAPEAIDRVMGDRLGFRGLGFADPEFDTDALYNTPGVTAPVVDGYQWPAGWTGYEILQPLMMVSGIRVHERGGKAIFAWSSARDAADLVVSDLDARPFGDRPGQVLEIEPADDLNAPDVIDVHFADVDNDNQKQLATAVRQGLVLGGQDPIREDVRLENVAMTFERATGLAQDLMRETHQRRDGARLTLPITWDYLEPGDIIRMIGNDAPGGGPWYLAIDRIERGDFLEIEAFVLLSPPITANALGSSFQSNPPRVTPSAPLAIEIIDLGPLRDGDATTPGYYVAASRFAPTNAPVGGAIWRKETGETNPHRVGSITELAVMGGTVYDAANVLGDAATDVIDETNTIDVDVFDGDLASVTEAELLAGANRCVLGDEILAFRDAVALDTGPRRFRLSGLLRGRNGTAESVLGHEAGERFVFLGHRSDPLPLNFVPAQLADVGTTHEVQAVHSGGSTDTVSEYPHQVEASTGRALPPYDLTATKQANGDIVFSWFRRSRIAWDSLDEPPRLAAEERYELLLNGGARIQTIVGNPLDPANAASVTYTAAHQAEDVLGITFSAEVRQVDPASGPGRTTQITVTS